MKPNCPTCKDVGWTCPVHPEHRAKGPGDDCCGGPFVPCGQCNPDGSMLTRKFVPERVPA